MQSPQQSTLKTVKALAASVAVKAFLNGGGGKYDVEVKYD
ncbi:hypothetical protein GCM10008936_06090 [Alkalibacterium indicireducens]|uniref:Uncharacterized protein n=1 Tax=Alkalibacterium indicireducens TaxID=398758 RepID=A0ABP3KFQ9_9LACT